MSSHRFFFFLIMMCGQITLVKTLILRDLATSTYPKTWWFVTQISQYINFCLIVAEYLKNSVDCL